METSHTRVSGTWHSTTASTLAYVPTKQKASVRAHELCNGVQVRLKISGSISQIMNPQSENNVAAIDSVYQLAITQLQEKQQFLINECFTKERKKSVKLETQGGSNTIIVKIKMVVKITMGRGGEQLAIPDVKETAIQAYKKAIKKLAHDQQTIVQHMHMQYEEAKNIEIRTDQPSGKTLNTWRRKTQSWTPGSLAKKLARTTSSKLFSKTRERGSSVSSSALHSPVVAPKQGQEQMPKLALTAEVLGYLNWGFQEIEIAHAGELGIYRTSAAHDKVTKALKKFSEGQSFVHILSGCAVNEKGVFLACLMKRIIGDMLSKPLVSKELFDQHLSDIDQGEDCVIQAMREVYSELDENYQILFKGLLQHLSTIASYSEKNKMGAFNLATVFALVIFDVNFPSDPMKALVGTERITRILATCIELSKKNEEWLALKSSKEEI